MQSWACDRAREAASLMLDGELSQLEAAFLDRHMRRCASCAAFAVEIQGATSTLRSAPLLSLARPIELPIAHRARFGARRAGAWIAAASAAAAALLAVMILPAQRVHSPAATPVPHVAPSSNDDLRDLRILRQAQMKPTALMLARTSPRGPEL